MPTIADIKNVFYINLEKRKDRRSHIEEQLTAVGFTNFERFNAFETQNGRIGCSLSHIKCLELAQARKYNHVLICEDDTLFTEPTVIINQLNSFLQSKIPFDVLMLAGNNLPPYTVINETCVKVQQCQTATCYLVMAHYFQTLIKNYKEGLRLLLKQPENHFFYALDKYWFTLQQKDKWYLLTPLTVVQLDSYSDIENCQKNYAKLMLDLDKTALIQRALQQHQLKQQVKKEK
jgi:glycosyl transferase family 25